MKTVTVSSVLCDVNLVVLPCYLLSNDLLSKAVEIVHIYQEQKTIQKLK